MYEEKGLGLSPTYSFFVGFPARAPTLLVQSYTEYKT